MKLDVLTPRINPGVCALRIYDQQRDAFANDPDNLRATTAQVNRSKSDHGPEHWMPQVDACAYAHDFVRVATRYQLTVTAARAAALQRACT